MAYTTIDDPSAHFQTATYTGNGGSDRAIVNDGNSAMQPDWVWYKSRSNATSHITYDSSRGDGPYLKPSDTGDEGTDAQMFESFDSDGFSLNGDTDGNGSGRTYVAWQWKANGGTTASNTDGTVTTTTQVNSDAGFSIVTWAGGGTGTLGHGLGETPDMWIIKNRDYAVSWAVGFSDSNILGGRSKYLSLNTTGAISTYNNFWGTSDGQISSTTIGAAGDRTINISGNDYVGYFFKAKQGYSKFGKYVGNGASDASPNTNGPFIYTGFSPAFVIIKKTSAVDDWLIFDNKRAGYDPAVYRLFPNSTSAETSGTNNTIQFTSNGFKIRFHGGSMNTSGGTYIYMAFAESSFVSSQGIPTTAR